MKRDSNRGDWKVDIRRRTEEFSGGDSDREDKLKTLRLGCLSDSSDEAPLV